jgi:hypothetical protein
VDNQKTLNKFTVGSAGRRQDGQRLRPITLFLFLQLFRDYSMASSRISLNFTAALRAISAGGVVSADLPNKPSGAPDL